MESQEVKAMRAFLIAVFVAVSGYALAQSPQAGIQVIDAWARSSEGGRETAVYLTIINRGERDDTLLGATSPAAERVVIEQLRIEDLKAKRRTLSSLKIESSSRLDLSPSSRYLAVSGLKDPLRPGQTMPITLRFANAGQVEVAVEVTNQELGNRGR